MKNKLNNGQRPVKQINWMEYLKIYANYFIQMFKIVISMYDADKEFFFLLENAIIVTDFSIKNIQCRLLKKSFNIVEK